RSKSIAAIWLEKVVTPLIDPAIKGFAAASAVLKTERLKVDKARNSAAYKEYYVIASGASPPKTKASVRKMQSSSDSTMTSPTAVGTRISTSSKGKQPANSSKAK
nr:hypothetical protein [Tanacetum cinerariifolium]